MMSLSVRVVLYQYLYAGADPVSILICLKARQSQSSDCVRMVSTYVKLLLGPLAHELSCTLPDCWSRIEDWLLEKSAKIQAAFPQEAEAWRPEHGLTDSDSGIPHRFQLAHGEDRRMRPCFVENYRIFQSLTSNSQLVGGEAISGKYRHNNILFSGSWLQFTLSKDWLRFFST